MSNGVLTAGDEQLGVANNTTTRTKHKSNNAVTQLSTVTQDSTALTIAVLSSPTGSAVSTTSSTATSSTSTPHENAAPATTSGSTTSSISKPSASKPTTSVQHSKPHSKGELAGVAIGTALGAAIITFLITYLLLRRKRSRHEQGRTPITARSQPSYSDEGNAKSGDAAYAAFVPFLPQSADDNTMGGAVKSLFDQIELHVDNYYQRIDLSNIDRIGESFHDVPSAYLPAPLDELLRRPDLQLAVIKHCLASILISRILPSTDPVLTLLPPHLSLLPERKVDAASDQRQSRAIDHAYSQWKSLTSYLNREPGSNETFVNHRANVASELVEAFTVAFWRWQSKSTGSDAAKEHLTRVVEVASNVGISIMAQPSAFEFRWRRRSKPGGEGEVANVLTVLPAFVKTTDNKGEKLARSQTMVPAVTR